MGLSACLAVFFTPFVVHAHGVDEPSPEACVTEVSTRSNARAHDLDRGAYLHVSPVGVHVPMGDEDFTDIVEPGYAWELGAGYFLAAGRRRSVGLGFGASFEHVLLNFEDEDDAFLGTDPKGGMYRIQPQFRIGWTRNTVFAYGLLSPGLTVTHVIFAGGNETNAGAHVGVGAGIQGTVWRGLSLGAELGVDVDLIQRGEPVELQGTHLHNAGLQLIVGWYF